MSAVERSRDLREQYAPGGTLDDQLLLHPPRRKPKQTRRSLSNGPPASPELIRKLQSRR